MKQALTVALGFVFLGAACQSAPPENPQAERARLLAQRPAIDSVPRSGLGPQELQPGECGLFLWSQTDVSKFIFFSRALSGTALFAQDEAPMALTQSGAGGNIFGQFNTEMRYIADDGRQLELTLEPGDELQGGQRVERGLINLTDGEGWQTKLPALGVRACQPE